MNFVMIHKEMYLYQHNIGNKHTMNAYIIRARARVCVSVFNIYIYNICVCVCVCIVYSNEHNQFSVGMKEDRRATSNVCLGRRI